MTWERFGSKAALAERGLQFLRELLIQQPEAHLLLATGASPEPLYKGVPALGLDLSGLWVSQLDEWVGLPSGHPASSERVLRDQVVEPWGIKPERFLAMRTDAKDPGAEITRVAKEMNQRPRLDLAIVGVGPNGHLGLNEPASSLSPWAGLRELAESTRTHGMLAKMEDPPTQGMTFGPGEILAAERVLLLVVGSSKVEAAERLKESRVTPEWPVTFLALHPRLCVLQCL